MFIRDILIAKQLLEAEELAECSYKSIKGCQGFTGSGLWWLLQCLERGRDVGLETLVCLPKRRGALGKWKSIKTVSPNQSDSSSARSLLLESLASVSHAPDQVHTVERVKRLLWGENSVFLTFGKILAAALQCWSHLQRECQWGGWLVVRLQ